MVGLLPPVSLGGRDRIARMSQRQQWGMSGNGYDECHPESQNGEQEPVSEKL
jgi:hypothetical protein